MVVFSGDEIAQILFERAGFDGTARLEWGGRQVAMAAVRFIVDDGKPDEVLDAGVDSLELSVRNATVLESAGIATVRDLVRLTDLDYLKLRNSGRKSLREIQDRLADRGLRLGMNP
jgi:DNA-directed RNA polymerase alpha subunit